MRGWSVILGGWGDRRGVSVDMKISARGARPSLFELPVALPGHHVSLRARDEVRQIANTIIIIRETASCNKHGGDVPHKAGGCFPDDPEDDGPRTTERKEDRCCDNKLRGCEASRSREPRRTESTVGRDSTRKKQKNILNLGE